VKINTDEDEAKHRQSMKESKPDSSTDPILQHAVRLHMQHCTARQTAHKNAIPWIRREAGQKNKQNEMTICFVKDCLEFIFIDMFNVGSPVAVYKRWR
jgi:hypothetical protein